MSVMSKHGCNLKNWLVVILVLCLLPAAHAAERQKIGLVLAGGGAKGAAHIGVLKVLEELRIPIDCIAGTSMGALVGGTYSAGLSAAEIETVVLGNDWTDTFTNREVRDDTLMRRKLSGVTYSNQLEFGISGGRVRVPGGLVSTQGVEEMIRNLVAEARGVVTFDTLPIPFRAVATDVLTGQMMVFDRGELEVAMRA
ncbi:MAG: patatin-like phospholipase family protein, partial [Proteobacteria bacterium]|nr:patatin-like phospholipase family protein [Pseudomonadota bacterium]